MHAQHALADIAIDIRRLHRALDCILHLKEIDPFEPGTLCTIVSMAAITSLEAEAMAARFYAFSDVVAHPQWAVWRKVTQVFTDRQRHGFEHLLAVAIATEPFDRHYRFAAPCFFDHLLDGTIAERTSEVAHCTVWPLSRQ